MGHKQTRNASSIRRALARRGHSDRGVIALEFVMVMSAAIALFMLILGYAVKAHSERIATAAAEQGLAAATTYNGTVDAATTTTSHYLRVLGGGLTDTQVQVTRTAQTATVRVDAKAPAFLPFLPMSVHVEISSPIEQVVAPDPAGGAT